MFIDLTMEGVKMTASHKWLVNTYALKKGIEINITFYKYGVSMAGAVGQMNSF